MTKNRAKPVTIVDIIIIDVGTGIITRDPRIVVVVLLRERLLLHLPDSAFELGYTPKAIAVIYPDLSRQIRGRSCDSLIICALSDALA